MSTRPRVRPSAPPAASHWHVTRRVLLAWAPLAALAGAAGCGGGGGAAATAPATIAPAANVYLTAALDTMQRRSLNKYKLGWPSIRAAAFATAGAAQRTADTYAAIDQVVKALGDGHSSFFRPGTFDRAPADLGALLAPPAGAGSGPPRYAGDPAPSPINVPSGTLLDARTGYVFVPYFVGTNARGRADSTLAVVRTVDSLAGPAGPCGWVIDLRLNAGGNLAPMVAGLGPILGDGRAGMFVDADSNRTYWFHRAGTYGQTVNGVDTPLLVASTPYVLRRLAAPGGTPPAVAVLYGDSTASSGEATAISFRGLPNARSFGTLTYGLTTGNYPYPMSDGAVLNLAVSVEGDRTGVLYGGKLTPDVPTAKYSPNPAALTVDPTMRAAVQWLAAQPACAGR